MWGHDMAIDKNRLRAAEMQGAIHQERFEALMNSLRNTEAEIARRLDELNGEYQRIRTVQNVSVTAEKFDDYVATQRRAVELELKGADEKFTALAQRNIESIRDLGDRMLRIEQASEERERRSEHQIEERQRKQDKTNRWLLAGFTAFVTVVVLAVNVWFNTM